MVYNVVLTYYVLDSAYYCSRMYCEIDGMCVELMCVKHMCVQDLLSEVGEMEGGGEREEWRGDGEKEGEYYTAECLEISSLMTVNSFV